MSALARTPRQLREAAPAQDPDTSPRIARHSQAFTVALALLFGCAGAARADPPAGGSSANDAQSSVRTEGFFSSLKQAFKQDFGREVVRGHFEVGSAPDTHRYYCLVDPKTGKRETNGVAGQPVLRADGTTAITSGAVSFYSCVDAEQRGILVTTGYIVSAGGAQAPSAPAPKAPAAPRASADGRVQSADAREPSTDGRAQPAGPVQTEVMAAYMRFIDGQNTHDRAAVSDMLLDSRDFVWAQSGGQSIWGHKEAMEAFQDNWKGTWRLDPQPQEMRIASIAPGVAVLITPLLFTHGETGEKPSTVPIRWGGVFVKTSAGWRISSIFITPFDGWHAAGGS